MLSDFKGSLITENNVISRIVITYEPFNTRHSCSLQVFASDADSGMNGQIEYSIVSGNHNEAFVLDSVRGILATKVLLDREITPSYKYALLTH